MARYVSGDDLAFQRLFALGGRQDRSDPTGAGDASRGSNPSVAAGAVDAARAAVEALPEPQRVVVHLHLAEHLSFEQIAEVLGLTPQAVRQRAREAYGRLQLELKSYVRSTNKE